MTTVGSLPCHRAAHALLLLSEPLKKRVKRESTVKKVGDLFFIPSLIASSQKSQTQSRTSTSSRRKTRVMSDEEDMMMDETNQVSLHF